MALKSAPIVEKIKAGVAAKDPNSERKARYVFLLNITENDKQVAQYTMDLKQLKVYEGPFDGTPDVTITIDDQTLLDLGLGKIAAGEGNTKFEGDETAINAIKFLANNMNKPT